MKPIYIFEASSMMGMRDHKGQWWKVVQACVRCGECCMDNDPGWIFAQDEMVGGCKYLEEREDDGLFNCTLMMYRPLGCCVSNPHTIPEFCSIVMEPIDAMDQVLSL